MRNRIVLIFVFVVSTSAFAQSDRGTITGRIIDPAGAVIPNAQIEAKNSETGTLFDATSTTTGNYALLQVPAGIYQLTVSVPGFKQYLRTGITVLVAQTLTVDVALEVGAQTETVIVNADAPLLKTESGELSHNVQTSFLNDLPVFGMAGYGVSNVRDPLFSTQLVPGTSFVPNRSLRVNGTPTNSQSIRIEGQDATNGSRQFSPSGSQAGMEAIQEVSIQTSNYAAEYGKVGGGFLNFTMKSGTNQFHGSAYDYIVNEAFNAGQPFTDDGNGHRVRQPMKRHDYGFALGGPVWIPHLYNGRDRTFFFVSFEEYRENVTVNNQKLTVPIADFLRGDFSSILKGDIIVGGVPVKDPLGRTIRENAVYDPTLATGQTVRNPFPNNIIPLDRIDPVAKNVLSLLPDTSLQLGGAVNNLIMPYKSPRTATVPSVKVDHSVGTKARISFYYSATDRWLPNSPGTGSTDADGLPLPISAVKQSLTGSWISRVNADYTLTPTLLLHAGMGYQSVGNQLVPPVTDYNAASALGLNGLPLNRDFPRFSGMSSTSLGGLQAIGPSADNSDDMGKTTGNLSANWVKGNHTFKAGGEFRVDGYPGNYYTSTAGTFTFSTRQTGLPSTQGQNLGGKSIGFAFASFLLGQVDSVTIAQQALPRLGKHQLSFYFQDTWKVNRRLTVDYGLRWDYDTYLREQYGRFPSFSPSTPNPLFGNVLGAPIFEGSGSGRCDCAFANNYPYAFGPRLGLAYQVNQKTVLRGGFAIVYDSTSSSNGVNRNATLSVSLASGSAGYGNSVMSLQNGIPPTIVAKWPNYDPSVYPFGSSPTLMDRNAGRPARQIQWSIGLQREIYKNLAVEVSYVGNRGVWWSTDSLNVINQLTTERLAQFGLDITNAADQTLLTSTLSSSTAKSRTDPTGRSFSTPPFPGFPTNQTVAQSLRPYPQYTDIDSFGAPLGNTWYDSLQAKVTKRFSHGLDFTWVFTWSKQMTLGVENAAQGPGIAVTSSGVTDPTNRAVNRHISGYDQPLTSSLAVNYLIPSWKLNKAVSLITGGWQIGAFLQYASGMPIAVPQAQNKLGTMLPGMSSNSTRVAGVPLYNVDINSNDWDPATTLVLNKNAWVDPPAGTFGYAASYYSDYRQRRRPSENMSLQRWFRFGERASLQIRMELANILNRTYMRDPSATNALATTTTNANGKLTGGFGYIDTAATPPAPARAGTLVVRVMF